MAVNLTTNLSLLFVKSVFKTEDSLEEEEGLDLVMGNQEEKDVELIFQAQNLKVEEAKAEGRVVKKEKVIQRALNDFKKLK